MIKDYKVREKHCKDSLRSLLAFYRLTIAGVFIPVGILLLSGCTGENSTSSEGEDEVAPRAGAFSIPDTSGAMPKIWISTQADRGVSEVAAELAEVLDRMFQTRFEISTGEGEKGIFLGLAEDFLSFAPRFSIDEPEARDGFRISSEQDRLLLVGASVQGLRNAVWSLLEELGYRQFFPGKTWEVVPQLEKIAITLSVEQKPSFATRRVFFGYNTWPELREDAEKWRQRNRMASSFKLNTGHAWDAIESRNKEVFQQHPEYLCKPLGTSNNKFIVAEKGLRELVVKDALAQLGRQPDLDSISIDPSDGGNWPEHSLLGTPSDQVVTLANEVSSALQQAKPGTKVGIYAYHEHSPPPTVRLNPHIIVSVATSFIRGGHRFEDLVHGWRKQGAEIGVRDYLGVWPGSFDLPGRPASASFRSVAKRVASFHKIGARYYIAEANHGFGPSGPGLYLVARTLWDVRAAEMLDSLLEDFYEKAFGPAKEEVRLFYQLIDGDASPLLSDHLLGEMCRSLEAAYRQTANYPEIAARLDDLAAYTQFVGLFRRYRAAKGAARAKAYAKVVEFANSIRLTGMVHTFGMLRDQPGRDRALNDFSRNMSDIISAAKEQSPVNPIELRQWIAEGAMKFEKLAFEPRGFSDQLVPLLPPEARAAARSKVYNISTRGANTLYTYLDKPDQLLRFSVKGGLIYGSRGPVHIGVFPVDEPFGNAVTEVEIPPDKAFHSVEVRSGYEGLHRLEIADGGDLTTLQWPDGVPLAIPAGANNAAKLHFRNTLYFFVPKGATQLGGYSDSSTGEVVDQDGKVQLRFSDGKPIEFFNIGVPDDQKGAVWSIRHFSGKKLLLNTPAYFAPAPQLLLVPEEMK